MTEKELNELIENKMSYVNLYTKEKTKEIKNGFDGIEKKYKDFQIEIEKSLLNSKESNEYSDYVKYLVSEDFDEKQKKFIEQIEKTILENLPKKNNNTLYIYAAIGVLFALLILLFIVK